VHLYIAPNGDVDTLKIEKFLMVQEGVVDANVWLQKGSVLARVTLVEDVHCEEGDLRSACERELGSSNTPTMIMLQRALRPAA
jgi:hypothetical protein